MKIKASAGRDRSKDLRDYCHNLTLTVYSSVPEEDAAEGELLSRVYREFVRDNGDGRFELLRYLRRKQK